MGTKALYYRCETLAFVGFHRVDAKTRSNVLDNSPRDKILLFGASSVAWFRWWGAIEPKFIHRSIAWHCWTSGAARNPLCIKGMPTRHTLRIPRRARFQSNSPALYNPW